MQAEMGDKVHHVPRPGGVRPTRWIPAEVWQRQGMTAQEMTLPLGKVENIKREKNILNKSVIYFILFFWLALLRCRNTNKFW